MGQNGDAVHRLPELRYSLMPFKLLGMRARLDADYTNFYRAGLGYDEANGTQGFQPTYPNPNTPSGGGCPA